MFSVSTDDDNTTFRKTKYKTSPSTNWTTAINTMKAQAGNRGGPVLQQQQKKEKWFEITGKNNIISVEPLA